MTSFDLSETLRVLIRKGIGLPQRHLELSQRPGSDWTRDDRCAVLDYLASLLTEGPAASSAAVHRACRPIVPELFARLLSGKPRTQRALERVAFAVARALPVFGSLLCSQALRHFSSTPSLFDWLAVADPATSGGDTTRAGEVLCTAAALFSDRRIGQVLSENWGCRPAVAFLASPDPAVAAAAARALAARWSVPLPRAVPGHDSLSSLAESQSQSLESALAFLNDTSSLDPQWVETVFRARRSPAIRPAEEGEGEGEGRRDAPGSIVRAEDMAAGGFVDVRGVLLPRKRLLDGGAEARTFQRPAVVETPTTARNVHALALAVSQGTPVLLEGPTGSAKTVLVEHLAALTGNEDLVRVHLGDQTDAKTLLGSYVTTEVPSEFRWQPGVLAQAVSRGLWILIEDIDIAPMDVLSVLIPLLETRRLFVPGRGEVLEAAGGFQLFATRTLIAGSGGTARAAQGRLLLDSLWSRVIVEPLSGSELAAILAHRFRAVSDLATRFVETFEALSDCFAHRSQFLAGVGGAEYVSPTALSRPPSTRDVIKWAARIDALHGGQPIVQQPGAPVSSSSLDAIFSEAMDCFCASVPSKLARRKLADVIARVWLIIPDKVTFLVDVNKPAIQVTQVGLSVGRASLERPSKSRQQFIRPGVQQAQPFAHTGHTLRLLEQIALCVSRGEPVLLVGETGSGKTSVVQHLASQLGRKLVVQNLSQQTESADLIGGFKPVELRLLCVPIKERFEAAFAKTFSKQANTEFLSSVQLAFAQQDWGRFIQLLRKSLALVEQRNSETDARAGEEGENEGEKKPKPQQRRMPPALRQQWRDIAALVSKFDIQQQVKNSLAFSFVEGSLVKAVRNGDWVLLDEINLATTETLEGLSGLLEGGSLTLSELGALEPVARHPDFRIFACMNPPTDVGKKDLPPGLRNRFTEIFVEEMDAREDLRIIVHEYLREVVVHPPVDSVVDFYAEARRLAQTSLTSGSNQKTHYSLRTLTRALQCTAAMTLQFGFPRALFEGFSMSFLTQLNAQSQQVVQGLIKKHLSPKGLSEKQLRALPAKPAGRFVAVEHFWIEVGSKPPVVPEKFIITESIRGHLASIARAVVSGRNPVLLQGPTSTGKTSMVAYLAQCTGHKFVRINNHEHTDIQEYLGSYVGDASGKLVFREGALVDAVRNGHWVLLDELNLAPSEVLEALNRLLDANRELFVPETQEVVRAHPHFMLFATQNPPGLYGGRKVLSRAFRNRFVEIHVDDLPDAELQFILEKRCIIPPTYSKLLVAVLKDLQRNRAITHVFAGRHAFITLRDLFRWAERRPDGYEKLAAEGYCLLVERLRREEDRAVVKAVLEKHLKVQIDPDRDIYSDAALHPRMEAATVRQVGGIGRIVWTKSMRRLFALVGRCLEHSEPVLLVGGAGTGKTSACQLWAEALGLPLRTLNCHQHTETADFLGGLRPIRGKDQAAAKLCASLRKFLGSEGSGELPELIAAFERVAPDAGDLALRTEVEANLREYRALFAWVDGPLVLSMRQGEVFLVDEISLAEDAVLERLNSVLEPGRTLFLAEKGGEGEADEIVASPNFRIVATMNPGGDFGKRELSPAMRNRFTEIWVPAFDPVEDLAHIIEDRLERPMLTGFARPLLDFVTFFGSKHTGRAEVGVREMLSWVSFMNACVTRGVLEPWPAYVHGACLVLLDGLGVGSGISETSIASLKSELAAKLLGQVPESLRESVGSAVASAAAAVTVSADGLTIGPFRCEAGPHARPALRYELRSPTTSVNAMRVLRALELQGRAVLLEGSPGVGKSSLVSALAAATGHRLTRINLSEQTDIGDLMGADLPVEGSEVGGEFAWRDGAFLAALKAGDWVLLDELNLASQSVLEGLNSVLDHRGEAFIPELGRSFKCPTKFRVFACQNPTQQGGGRKGLPKSFLSRFTQVFVDHLKSEDLRFISSSMFPSIDPAILSTMVSFNSRLVTECSNPTSTFARFVCLPFPPLGLFHFFFESASARSSSSSLSLRGPTSRSSVAQPPPATTSGSRSLAMRAT